MGGMQMIFKPMLAHPLKKEEFASLQFPLYASPKYDGIRCIWRDGVAWSRQNEPIPNKHIQRSLKKYFSNFFSTVEFDGELMIPDPDKPLEWMPFDGNNGVESCVMSEKGKPDFKYIIFDFHHKFFPFRKRFAALRNVLESNCIETCRHDLVTSIEHIESLASLALIRGYEGICLRSPLGLYKMGRSTLKEQVLLKYKPLLDDEAIIIGYTQKFKNNNEKEISKLGYAKRSKKKEGLQACNEIGALRVKWQGMEFELGTGFTQEQRKNLWNDRWSLQGQHVTFTYPGQLTEKGIPKHASFKRFRSSP